MLLLWGVFGLFLIGVGVVGAEAVKAMRTPPDSAAHWRDSADELARGGLHTALRWLRLQSAQPVAALPPAGLTQQVQICDDVWGGFAVQPQHAKAEHGGAHWRLRSHAQVVRRDAAGHPGEQLGDAVVEFEVRQLSLRLPGQAALCVRRAANLVIARRAAVHGGAEAVAVFAPAAGGAPVVKQGGELTGVAPFGAVQDASAYDDSVEAVFGVSPTVLFAMADERIDRSGRLPATLPPGSLTVVRCRELRLDKRHPLRGEGVLFIAGSLHLEAGNASRFRGLLYVDGDLTVHGPAEIRGAVLVTGSVLLQGHAGSVVVAHDPDILRNLRDTLCIYRPSSPIRRVAAAPGGSTGQ
ncbi:MAG: hypothetical protein KDC87_22395 [Planctomycetes bacterium]|nr:hypothetical protein [Planctomycetota bacterium]